MTLPKGCTLISALTAAMACTSAQGSPLASAVPLQATVPAAPQSESPSATRPDLSTLTVDESMNTPVEATVADRGALTAQGRVMPFELAMPQGFDRVYAVPGRPGLFYRASGCLYAVFTEGEYKKSKEVRQITLAPANTRYYIGKPDWSTIVAPNDIPGGSVMAARERRDTELPEPSHVARDAERLDQVDANAASPRVERNDVIYAPIGTELPPVSGNDVGFGGGSARATTGTDTVALSSAIEFAPSHPDLAAWMGVLPEGVSRHWVIGEGAHARPRIAVDLLYRQKRLTQLMQHATGSPAQE